MEALIDKLDPEREPGRLTFITRMGAGKIRDALPPLLDVVRRHQAELNPRALRLLRRVMPVSPLPASRKNVESISPVTGTMLRSMDGSQGFRPD